MSIPCEMCERNIFEGEMTPLPGYSEDVPPRDSRWVCLECVEELSAKKFYEIKNGDVIR